MNYTRVFELMEEARSDMEQAALGRGKGNFGIAVDGDPLAIAWQKFQRRHEKMSEIILTKLSELDRETNREKAQSKEELLTCPDCGGRGVADTGIGELPCGTCSRNTIP